MALPLHTTLVVSCGDSEAQSGPSLVHSTGVEGYRVPPQVIQILQQSCSNKVADHEQGVQCIDPPGHIIQTFQNAGFTVINESSGASRKYWMLTKTS